uniref:Protein kinase domain-containing protein n=1 Tax=Leersia perrieri TaxID=77586 RepID=A0A0D9XKZ5_9ORYZ
MRRRLWPWWIFLFVAAAAARSPESEMETYRDERGSLVLLRDAMRSGRDLHSNWTGPPCSGGGRSRWYGVSCDGDGRVIAVSLAGIQLTGELPAHFLSNVTRLETLSLRDNAVHGRLPRLEGLTRLVAVDLSGNRFSGPIPAAYAARLPELRRLELQDNLINGTLPDFGQRGLVVFNVSYNFLQGEVPDTAALRRFPATAFGHNLDLCGEVVRTECRREGSPFDDATRQYGGGDGDDSGVRPFDGGGSPARRRGFRLARWSVVVIAIIATVVPFAAVLIFLHHGKNGRVVRLGGRATVVVTGDIKDKATEHAISGKTSGSGSRSTTDSGKGSSELQFFRPEMATTFTLDELFRSTAEMLGKGTLGITYRVTLNASSGEPGPTVVVKRLRNMSHVSRKDFTHTMNLLGKLRHVNVVDVIASYYSKDEKLVVFDHVAGQSLFHLLHENRGEGRTPLTWQSRLAIAKGMAFGLSYLHQTMPLFHRPPHGNLKSSNILVVFPNSGKRRNHPVAKLMDYGFHPLLPPHGQQRLAAAKCPEFGRSNNCRRWPSSRADVYCLGLVLLELVTGKVPVVEDGDGDMAEWARMAVSHEWSTDILDVEIVADRERHGDMLRLTEVALLCAAVEPDRRPRIHEVVRMIDEIAGAGDGDGDGETAAGR